MAEEKAEAPEDVYDERRWWQILEEEKYLRPLTFYELKGEYENYCWVNFNLEVSSENWENQVEWIRGWYAGQQCDYENSLEISPEEVAADIECQRKALEYWDALSELEIRLCRPLILQDAIQEKERIIGQSLTEGELSEAKNSFEYWVECANDEAKNTASAVFGLTELIRVFQKQEMDGSAEFDAELNDVIKRHMTIDGMRMLEELGFRYTDSDGNSASDRAIKGHAKRHSAIAFVKAEWAKHREDYNGNKSAFARAYTRRLFREKGINVTERQMRDVWLLDNPVASNPDGL